MTVAMGGSSGAGGSSASGRSSPTATAASCRPLRPPSRSPATTRARRAQSRWPTWTRTASRTSSSGGAPRGRCSSPTTMGPGQCARPSKLRRRRRPGRRGAAGFRRQAFADFNNDGQMDFVALPNRGQSLPRRSGGGFTPGQFLPARPALVKVADVNSDGIPDIVFGDGDLIVYLGNGDGTFRPAPASPVPPPGGY